MWLQARRCRAASAVFFAGALAGACSCDKDKAKPPESGSEVEMAVVEPQGEDIPDITDEAIAEAIAKRLERDPVVASRAVDVSVTEGVVHLSGTQESYIAKKRAGLIAENVRGVLSAVNTIDVVPPGERTDDVIRSDVLEALALSRSSDAYELEVAVDDGTVRLQGQVDSWLEKNLAEWLAGEVRGVTGVIDELEVELVENRADAEIASDVEAAITWDAAVDEQNIQVSVEDQVVELRGFVGSAAQKRRAIADAWVAGVKEVEAKQLRVDPTSETFGVDVDPATDELIVQALQDALQIDPRIDAKDVEIQAEDGRVTLRGSVATIAAKRAAARDAYLTKGVLDVDDLLKVRPPGTYEAEKVRDLLRRNLARDPYVPADEVGVSIETGEARLTGEVAAPYQKIRAELAAARTPGVVLVNNRIRVNGTNGPVLVDPLVDDPALAVMPGYGAKPFVVGTSDASIEAEIQKALFWSPFIRPGDVEVAVEAGVVRLTGEVSRPWQRRAAIRAAFQGGAVRVINNVKIPKPGAGGS